MKLKKVMAGLLVSTMAAVMITGCGGQGAPAAANQSQTSGQASSQTEKKSQETESKSEVPEKDVILKVLGFKTGNELGTLPQLFEKFEEETGVKIEYEAIPTSANYTDVLKSRFATDEGPDVFMTHGGGELNLMVDVGYVEDLTEEDFMEKQLEEFTKFNLYQGKSYCFSIDSSGVGMCVNKTLLDENNLEIPGNWEEFENCCSVLAAAGKTPLIMGNKTGWSAGVLINTVFDVRHRDYNDTIYTDLVDGKVKYSEEYTSIFEKYKSIIDNNWTNTDSCLGMEFNDAAVAEFAKGDSAFLVGGTWMINQIKEALADKETVFTPLPGEEGEPVAKLMTGVALAINSKSENMDTAKELIRFFAKDENLQVWVDSQGAFTTLKNGTSTELAEAAPYADAIKKGNYTLGAKTDDRMKADMWGAITKAAQMITLKEMDAAEAGANLDEEFTKGQMLQQ